MESLSPVVVGDALAIEAGSGIVEEAVELSRFRTVAPDAGSFEPGDAVGSFDTGKGVVPLGEPEVAKGAAFESVDHLVGVGGAEPGENDGALVGFAIAIGVLKVDELSGFSNVNSPIAKLESHGDEEVFGEAVELVSASVAIGVFANEDVVTRAETGCDVRVGGNTDDPEPAAVVPAHLNRLHDTIGFAGEEVDLKTIGDLEGVHLLLRRSAVSGCRRKSDRRRWELDLFTESGLLDAAVCLREDGAKFFELDLEWWAVGACLAEALPGAITEGEAPVHGAPAVEPKTIFFEDGRLENS